MEQIWKDKIEHALYILDYPDHQKDWSVQGFGMLRTYLNGGDEWRLHIWHSCLRVEGVTDIHNHPWDFESLCIIGTIANERYRIIKLFGDDYIQNYTKRTIVPGKAIQIGPEEYVTLGLMTREVFGPGSMYRQHAREIHRNDFKDGAVTLIRRTNRGNDMADTFKRYGTEWVSAKPRLARKDEIEYVVGSAWRQVTADINQEKHNKEWTKMCR